jgi:hypothetical protein
MILTGGWTGSRTVGYCIEEKLPAYWWQLNIGHMLGASCNSWVCGEVQRISVISAGTAFDCDSNQSCYTNLNRIKVLKTVLPSLTISVHSSINILQFLLHETY